MSGKAIKRAYRAIYEFYKLSGVETRRQPENFSGKVGGEWSTTHADIDTKEPIEANIKKAHSTPFRCRITDELHNIGFQNLFF